METIGVIAAMSQECRALLRYVGKTERVKLGPFSCYRFQLSERNCILMKSGIGLKHAMNATRTLIAAERPHLIVSFGVAGAARDALQIGDVVIASLTFILDKGKEVLFHRLAPLSDAAWNSATEVLEPLGARLVSGTAVTTRISNPVRLLPEDMAHPVLDMETAGIKKVAAEHGIKLLALRAVSDGPQAPLPFDLEAITDKDLSLNIGKAIKMVLRHPHLILGSLRIIRNVEKAADNAAAALLAILGQTTIFDRLSKSTKPQASTIDNYS